LVVAVFLLFCPPSVSNLTQATREPSVSLSPRNKTGARVIGSVPAHCRSITTGPTEGTGPTRDGAHIYETRIHLSAKDAKPKSTTKNAAKTGNTPSSPSTKLAKVHQAIRRRRPAIWKQDPKAAISGNHINRSSAERTR